MPTWKWQHPSFAEHRLTEKTSSIWWQAWPTTASPDSIICKATTSSTGSSATTGTYSSSRRQMKRARPNRPNGFSTMLHLHTISTGVPRVPTGATSTSPARRTGNASPPHASSTPQATPSTTCTSKRPATTTPPSSITPTATSARCKPAPSEHLPASPSPNASSARRYPRHAPRRPSQPSTGQAGSCLAIPRTTADRP